MDFHNKGIYVMGTIRSNHISILENFKNKKLPQGTLLWKTDDLCKICALTWVDKKKTSHHNFHPYEADTELKREINSNPLKWHCKSRCSNITSALGIHDFYAWC